VKLDANKRGLKSLNFYNTCMIYHMTCNPDQSGAKRSVKNEGEDLI